MVVPFPIADSISKDPPESWARSLMVERPIPFLTVSRSNPWPLSCIVNCILAIFLSKREIHKRCFAVFCDIVHGFLRDAKDRRF